jgi:hypothetical protein
VTKQFGVKSLINVGTLTSSQSWLTNSVDTEFKESNGSAIKDEEALGKMVSNKRKAPAALYVHYLSNGLKCMVGATRWKRLVLSGKEKPMDVATASDEALTLLMYENYWPSWKDKHENKMIVRPPRYTKQEGMRYGEWNDEGIERFNELLEEVKKDRASAAGQRTDERYQMDWKDFNDTIESRRKRRKVTPDSKVRVANELEAEGNGDSESESDSE